LRKAGAQLVRCDGLDRAALRVAMRDAHGVFSTQPGPPNWQPWDAGEAAFGAAVADIAVSSGVAHLVYGSAGAVSDKPAGMGFFDSKWRVEAHVRTLPIKTTIVRPVAFFHLLMLPGPVLDEGTCSFFMHREQSIQLLAVEDMGKFVERIFADSKQFDGRTLEIASDAVTGAELERIFSQARRRPMAYSRFSEALLAGSPLLARLTGLFDEGLLGGHADLDSLRKIHPQMMSARDWIGRSTCTIIRQPPTLNNRAVAT